MAMNTAQSVHFHSGRVVPKGNGLDPFGHAIGEEILQARSIFTASAERASIRRRASRRR